MVSRLSVGFGFTPITGPHFDFEVKQLLCQKLFVDICWTYSILRAYEVHFNKTFSKDFNFLSLSTWLVLGT